MDISLLLGLIIVILNHGLELKGFFYLWNGKNNFLSLPKKLPKILSDHFPLMLDCGVSGTGSRYFMFENMWLNYEGFVEQVKPW